MINVSSSLHGYRGVSWAFWGNHEKAQQEALQLDRPWEQAPGNRFTDRRFRRRKNVNSNTELQIHEKNYNKP